MRAPTWSPRTVGLAVLVVGLALALLPSSGLLPAGWFAPTRADAGPPTLPTRFAGYSYLTGDVSTSPPGRAVAVYQHGFDVEFLDAPQAVVAGADGDIYRRLDAAEARDRGSHGDPAVMRLSPDGTRVAIGDWDTTAPDVIVIDRTTGDAVTYPVPGGRSAVPLAWAPDSRRLAYLTTAEPVNPYSGRAVSGDLGLLDVTTGTAELVPGQDGARAAAFSPDGRELAVHRITPDDGSLSGQDGIPRMGGGTVEVLTAGGTVDRRLAMPAHHYLHGPDAWSPDGALLATAVQWLPACEHLATDTREWGDCFNDYTGPEDGIVFLDATGGDAAVPAPVPPDVVGWDGLLGWTGDREVLVLDAPADPESAEDGLFWLTAVPLDGGEPRRLSGVPGGGNYGVGGFQVASALLPDIELRDNAGAVDRGLWPTWLRVLVALGAAGAVTLVARTLDRRGHAVRFAHAHRTVHHG